MKFVEVGGHQINVDNVETVGREHCGVCGWHYHVYVQMLGGNKVFVDDVSWDERWGEYGTHEAYEMGRQFLDGLCAAIARNMALVAS